MEEENGTRIDHKRANQSIPFLSQKYNGKQMKSYIFFQKMNTKGTKYGKNKSGVRLLSSESNEKS